MADKPIEAPSTDDTRVESYARAICFHEGTPNPEAEWPAGTGIKRWRWHIPAAVAVIALADKERAE